MPIKQIQSKSRLPESLQYNAWAPLRVTPVVVPAFAQNSTAIQSINPLGLNYKITHLSYTLSNFAIVPAGSNPSAAPAVPLASAVTYGILAGTTVTNTGSTTINGDLGLTPGSAITGSPTVTGATNVTNPAAVAAQNDLTAAYNNAAGRTPSISVPSDIGGLTLTPGVYSAASSLGITGTVTLNGQGNANAVWIFQIPTSLTTSVSGAVVLTNGASAKNVFWQVGSSATLGATSTFNGTILALTTITANTGAIINGRLLARNGAVNLAGNTITVPAAPSLPVPFGVPSGNNFAAGKLALNIVNGVGAYEGAGAASSYAYLTLGGTFVTGDKITVSILGIPYVYTVSARGVSLQYIGQALTTSFNRQTLNSTAAGIFPGFNTLYRANSLGAEVVIQTLAYSTATPSFTVSTNSVAGTVTASGATMVAGVAGALPGVPASDTTSIGIVPSQVGAVGTALFPVDIVLPLFNASQADLGGTIYAIENFDVNWPTLAEMTLRITADGVVAGGLNVILWGVPNDISPMMPEEANTAFHLSQIIL